MHLVGFIIKKYVVTHAHGFVLLGGRLSVLQTCKYLEPQSKLCNSNASRISCHVERRFEKNLLNGTYIQKMNSTALRDVSVYLPFFLIYLSSVKGVFYCFVSYNLEVGNSNVKMCLPECVLIKPEYHIPQSLYLIMLSF